MCHFTALIVMFIISGVISENRMIIMIDAGSSGSRLHVYTYNTRFPVPNMFEAPLMRKFDEKSWNVKVTPGVSSFYGHLNGIEAYLDQLMDFAKTHVPEEIRKDCPVYFYGTAGLRQIPVAESDAIMETVRDYFEKTEFIFERNHARVISGEEEGVFGWTTVNVLFERFTEERSETFGALDMGGASTQIAFEPESVPPKKVGFNITIGNFEYHLYDQSFLGFGIDRAEREKNLYLIKSQNSKMIRDGCLPKGYVHDFEHEGNVYVMVGTSNPEACYKACLHILNLNPGCNHCTVNGVYLPDTTGTFVAFSAFYYSANFLGLSGRVSPSTYFLAGEIFCSQNYHYLEITYKDTPSWKFITQYCFQGMYMSSLLIEAYKFPITEKNIIIQNQHHNIELGWTLGAALFQIQNH